MTRRKISPVIDSIVTRTSTFTAAALTRDGWSKADIDRCLEIIRAYFYGETPQFGSIDEAESGASEAVVKMARQRFARSCVINRVQGMNLPGKKGDWYPKEARAADQFINSSRR